MGIIRRRLCDGNLMVICIWIAQINPGFAGFCKGGFQFENGGRVLPCLARLLANHPEHFGDMGHVGFALPGECFREIIIAVRQAESTLAELEGVDFAVLGIRSH